MKKYTILSAATIGVACLMFTSIALAQTASSYSFSQNLAVGSSGADVTALQQTLAAKGYFSTTPTGYFGTITQAAVAAWQASVGLPSTGYFGPLSRAALGSVAVTPTSPSTPGCAAGYLFNTMTGAPCTTTTTPTGAAPTIRNISPIYAPKGAAITITGSGFTSTGNNIDFGVFRVATNLSSTDGTTLTFPVPQYGGADCAANTACPLWLTVLAPNPYQLIVKNANGSSNALTFTIISTTTTSFSAGY